MTNVNTKEEICYWCGNTGITWGDTDWVKCEDHDYDHDGNLSFYAKEAIEKFKK